MIYWGFERRFISTGTCNRKAWPPKKGRRRRRRRRRRKWCRRCPLRRWKIRIFHPPRTLPRVARRCQRPSPTPQLDHHHHKNNYMEKGPSRARRHRVLRATRKRIRIWTTCTLSLARRRIRPRTRRRTSMIHTMINISIILISWDTWRLCRRIANNPPDLALSFSIRRRVTTTTTTTTTTMNTLLQEQREREVLSTGNLISAKKRCWRRWILLPPKGIILRWRRISN